MDALRFKFVKHVQRWRCYNHFLWSQARIQITNLNVMGFIRDIAISNNMDCGMVLSSQGDYCSSFKL